MTSRKRKNSTPNVSLHGVSESNISDTAASSSRRERSADRRSNPSRDLRRRQLMERLEPRQMLAGPQLLGIQPNEGALITDDSVRDTSPRVLTFGFDENQVIDPSTFDGIRITRAGEDGILGANQSGVSDDIAVQPGVVTLGDPNQNEVVVRFADALPDDDYRIEVFGFDDAGLGVTGLRNADGEFFVPSDSNSRSQIINFKLSLGALVESVVPQPVIRNADGSLTQNRDEIVVYFNEDPLFVENDADGNPTERSAENPRFYQLLLTKETVRTTDDELFNPDRVVYDEATHTARLIFSDDINNLPTGPQDGHTWRLRLGTAVDSRADFILAPSRVAVTASAVTDFQHPGLRVTFAEVQVGESMAGREVIFADSGFGGLSVSLNGDGDVIFDLGGSTATVQSLKDIVTATPAVAAVIDVRNERNNVSNGGSDLVIPRSVVGSPGLQLHAAGETLTTSLDVGIFGQDNQITSFTVSESIDPQPFLLELSGGNDDPGHRELANSAGELRRHISPDFGPDVVDGVTEIAYNFKGIFDSAGGTDFLNQITPVHRERIREVLSLWSAEIGVQFRETLDQGITFAIGDTASLQPVTDTTLVSPNTNIGTSVGAALNASLRIDPTFNSSAIVFSNQTDFDLDYGEDFTRKATAGLGFLLGLEQGPDLPPQSIMSLDTDFLNESIDAAVSGIDLEPVFPSNYDVQHGQYIHRPDSVDIDLYRFEVQLGDEDKVGKLTLETFAERLPDSSLLDTTVALFEEQTAFAESDLGAGSSLGVTFQSLVPGRAGNGTEVRFIRSDRVVTDTDIKVRRVFDELGNPIANTVLLDLPRRGVNVSSVSAQSVADAINEDPFASSILRVSVTKGDPATDISGGTTAPLTVRLIDGGLKKLSQNDDYFSEDSRIIATLGEGVYYVGVSASGNDSYDPTIPGSGYGGRTQGAYDLQFKFEPQVDEVDVIRDRDNARAGVPGTALDGDGDGTPGGPHNFWFQTTPANRLLNFTDDGRAVTPGQEITVVSGSGIIRTYEFVPSGQAASPGNIPVPYSDGSVGIQTPPGNLAAALASAINLRTGETGVVVTRVGNGLRFVGERSIDLSEDFRAAQAIGRNIFVDKTAGPNADGSLARPFNSIANPDIANAFGSTLPGDIVRIVGNGGQDGDISTEVDNASYQIGVSNVGGQSLEDGRAMEVPLGVTTMVDAGVILKMRASYASVGSNTLLVDRSEAALQILGAPRLVQLSPSGQPVVTTLIGDTDSDDGGYDDGSVIITSIRDRLADLAAVGISPDPAPGDWGGLIFRRNVDQFEGREDLEDVGIFLQRVNHAEIRYGGSSNVLIDSVQQLVNPIQIVNLRPTITFNEITRSADSAISASPDSFEETSYQAPRFQQAGTFTADYDRVGPDINNNQLTGNSVNGLFVRVPTTATETPRELTVAGRFDDIDVVHVLPENLVVASTPGGSIEDQFAPSLSLVSARQLPGGSLSAGDYVYKMTFVDAGGFESLASADEFSFSVTEDGSSVELTALPLVQTDTGYVSRRLYRSVDTATPQFRLVADLDASSIAFVDNQGLDANDPGLVTLDLNRQGIRGRLDASLVLDPGLVVKLSGTRIELQPGSVLLAEGDGSNPIALTSVRDDRFGAGGTFDTNNDATNQVADIARPGDWAGIYAGPTATVSFDNVFLSYAGGISLIEGGETYGFVPLQLQQAEGRITNSRFEFNDSGQDGAGPAGRFGRLSAAPATIFVRGSQPIIVGNTFADNDGSIIDIDADSLTADRRFDVGRQIGDLDRNDELDDNFGPLIRLNRYEDNNIAGLNQITGLEIRGGTLATESVWDDTDIVHLLFDSIVVDNVHSGGGLKLRSRPDESLVVKLGDQGTPAEGTTSNAASATSGQGTPNSPTIGTGLTASGTPNDASDRIGGSVSILGLPDAPVVLTSFRDDTVGAGLTPDGTQFTDNNGDGSNSRPEPNDWRSILLEQYSNDRNVDIIPELELSTASAPGLNGTVANAQVLGELAASLTASDEVLRLGFEVEGYLSNPNDVDTYSFIGRPGTEVWVDIDKTSFTLDSVIELLDSDGNVLARSNDSGDEIAAGSVVDVLDSRFEGVTTSLQARDPQYSEFGAGGVYEDFDTVNPRDAGIHFTLTGNSANQNSTSTYFFRVRSASTNPDDAAGGLTRGGYRFQVRLTEDQEFPGSVVRYSDIRYANHGIHVRGLLSNSPLLGEATENETAAGFDASNDRVAALSSESVIPAFDPFFGFFNFAGETNPSQHAQYLGNLTGNRNNVISVAGELGFDGNGGTNDVVDFFQIDVFNDDVDNALRSAIFDIDYADGFNRPDTNISVFFDPDGEFDETAQPVLILHGSSSNILDDLTSPNGENDSSEKLDRGSISNGDPLIGPVTLVEGTYYVAVTNANQTPVELLSGVNPNVRREPVNSVRRIAEDRFDTSEGFSTAGGPVLPELFTDAAITAGGFVEVLDGLSGHGRPVHYDGSFGDFGVIAQGNPESLFFGDAADNFIGGANRATTLNDRIWSLEENASIGGASIGFGFTGDNTSTSIPHVTIDGNLGGELADFYEFNVPVDGGRVILDIDGGFDPNENVVIVDDLINSVNVDPGSINTSLYLFQEDPANPGQYLAVTSDVIDIFGDIRDGRLGSTAGEDAFIDINVALAGNYVVAVVQSQATVAVSDTGSLQVSDVDPLPFNQTFATYQLHVSVEDFPLPVVPIDQQNQAIQYDRLVNASPGTLVSEEFDLTGYVAEDLPTVYFNYRFAPQIDDVVEIRVISDDDTVGQVIASPDTNQLVEGGELFADSVWRQLRADIGDFAGHTNVRLQVSYTPSQALPNTTPGFETFGLVLDDFIVGFAERGETVFGASFGNTSFTELPFGQSPQATNLLGEYQLETRSATEYALPNFNGTTLVADFDTNDRHTQSLTIVAPAGNQLIDGDTFVIGDGSFNQTFEFTTTPGTVQFGNTPVLFNPSNQPYEIAQSIRTAINQQSNIDIEASSSAGQDNEDLTDGRLSLSGSARGSFLAVDSVEDGFDPTSGNPAPALSRDTSGNVLLLAILHDGLGDSNHLRTQGQVIIDSNRISDVRAIGIWSEPGDRDFDPEFARPFFIDEYNIDGTHPFMQYPPLGNSSPGAARNLPTLNDSVIGGLAPGVVISNNVIDQAGYSGIKVDGEAAPFVIDAYDLASEELEFLDGTFGAFDPTINLDVEEGTLLTIDAAGTRVVFEFEEINGATTAGNLGSNTVGGNGVADGHIPIYYREDPPGSDYNVTPAGVTDPRLGYSSLELAQSIYQSIIASPLVTNGLVQLVNPVIAPSVSRRNEFLEGLQFHVSEYPTAAVYLEGVTNVFISDADSGAQISQAPIAESVQPFARIVNNTIYGSDGRESLFPQSNDESNDLLSQAIDTKVGPSHRDVYTSDAFIGDNVGPVSPSGDVDFYQVNLGLGDRLIVDIDTVVGNDPNAPLADTAVQIFNARGERQTFAGSAGGQITVGRNDTAPDYLEPNAASYTATPATDVVNSRDAFADFFAPEKGVYYVAVSGEDNTNFEPMALSGRSAGADNTGAYTINLKTFAPRTHVISSNSNARTGIRGADLLPNAAGDDFSITVTQIPDLDPNAIVNGRTNRMVFRFGNAGPGEVGINITDESRLSDIMRAISAAIDPVNQNNSSVRNNDSPLAPGPIARVHATALGGVEGENEGIANLIRRGVRLQDETPPIGNYGTGNGLTFVHRDQLVLWTINGEPLVDFSTTHDGDGDTLGFGHDVRDVSGSNSNGNGTTENYVFIENAALIEISPQAAQAGLSLDPEPGFDTDQLINETGVMITSGASPALLNNVFLNLHESVVLAESRRAGFGAGGGDQTTKPSEVVVVSNTFQHDESIETVFQQNQNTNHGISTGPNEPSNINGGTDDFNVTNADNVATLVNPAGDNFLPAAFSSVIDTNTDSLIERAEFSSLKDSVGIPNSNVLAPTRDVTGINRADNPLYSNTGQGSSVFGDRGAVELADFVGPTAFAEAPRDNDAEGVDGDPNESFITLTGGIYEEFRIQLRDAGDASDPFTGSGIDNNTVVVPEIPGLRPSGANVALFEDDRLLTEGLEYTFNYDETKNIITLTPLAGIWQGDRSYRIQLNNFDRTVVRAPNSTEVRDGDQIQITDTNGGQVVFEFESGYIIQMPEPITLSVPTVGTNQGGLTDGGIFTINDGVNSPVVFEFDADGTTLPSSVRIPLPGVFTPTDPVQLSAFLADVATSIETAIQSATTLDIDVRVDIQNDPSIPDDIEVTDARIIIGAERGARVDVSTSGLIPATRTLGLQVPGAGADVGGVNVGDTFTINDGETEIVFEFTDANTPAVVGTPIDISPIASLTGGIPLSAAAVANAIQQAILDSPLELTPDLIGQNVHLDLPAAGSASISNGQMRLVSLSRTAQDEDLVVFSPNDGAPDVKFEINRTDLRDETGQIINDTVENQTHVPINITRLTTGDELAQALADAIQSRTIAGLNDNQVRATGDGILSIGGQTGLGLEVNRGEQIRTIGAVGDTGAPSLSVFLPLALQLPAGPPADGEQFTLSTIDGTDFVFEFDQNNALVNTSAIAISYSDTDTNNEIGTAVANAIRASAVGVDAVYTGGGQVSLGQIGVSRVDVGTSSLTVSQPLPLDGEVLTISQGNSQISFEFESAIGGGGVTAGNIPVVIPEAATSADLALELATTINANRGGLNLSASIGDELVVLRGLAGTLVDANDASSLALNGQAVSSSIEVVGSPGGTGTSTLEVFGPLILQMPFELPADGDVIRVQDAAGGTIILEFDDNRIASNPTATLISLTGNETQDVVAGLVADAINQSGAGLTATAAGNGQVTVGRVPASRVDVSNSTVTIRRGIVSDGEVLTIRQSGVSVSYEFERVNGGGGVAANNVPIPFQADSSTIDVANSLAAAINSNSNGLQLDAAVEENGSIALVALQDLPGTVVDVSSADSLLLTGVPGGSIPVSISPVSTPEDIKQALLDAINSVNAGPNGEVTSLRAEDRGGNTLFVENGVLFEGPITSYFLPAIRDLQGNPLEANRQDNTTQFTILMPTVGLDFGDAPDPVGNIPGRYPTALANDGARHVVGGDLRLGTQIDVDASAQASRDSDGDDAVTSVTETGSLFSVSFVGGKASVNVNAIPADPAIHEGNTITINTGVTTATLEFDTDNRFDEDHFPIQPTDLNSADSILLAIEAAINESPVEPAGITFVSTSILIDGDDEDGINFKSLRNPGGVFNRNVVTPIEVTVTGSGILQGWIDYDADGDWSSNEAVQFYDVGADPTTATGRTQVPLTGEGTRTFTFDTFFPQSTPDPLSTTRTAARFRISKTGDLSPTGLSLSGEVEDYQVLLVAGTPPALTPEQRVRTFAVNEGDILQALDGDGMITGSISGDDGLLAGVVDPDGDQVRIVPEDAVVRTLTTENGTVAGELDLELDGTFTFRPEPEFNGLVSFTARVTDIQADVSQQLVSPEPLTITIDVVPVNDSPFATSPTVEFNEQTNEDESVIFTAEDLIDPFYLPGPANESGQLLVFQSVSSTNLGDSVSSRGGILEILAGGRSIRYTPPADFNGSQTDVFNFVVADVPAAGQIIQSAAKPGTVSVTVAAVNDPPEAGDDFFNAVEDTALNIAIRGSGSLVGILDNDVAGPTNETQAPESQTVSLVSGQFPVQTARGGVVRQELGQLVYSPPGLYSGPDGFTYRIVDSEGAESTGTVSIEVGGENDAPLFQGVDGVSENGIPVTDIALPESKPDAQSSQYDLNTWFTDPENDAMTYAVTSSNNALAQVTLDGSTLTISRPAFAFGTVTLNVVATDVSGLSTSQNVSVQIVNENDSPLLIGALDPQSTDEDETLAQELTSIFSDPDGDNLAYTVARLDSIIRPTAQQIADHPLLDSITFVGDQMRVVPAADQSGNVFIEIEASDGSFRSSDSFTLTINPLPDEPIAGIDGYNVAVGSTLRVLNPAEGLLRNDFDADGETIQVDLASVSQPQFGTLQMNSNGTFIYVNTTGTIGETDSFEYRVIDSSGRVSPLTTVTLNLGQSQYQNPIPGMASDVNADGAVSPIDALLVINLIARRASAQGSLPVASIGTPPPDYVDSNGDGQVTALDALLVINTLALRQANGGEGEGVSLGVAAGSTTSFAAPSSDFLPVTNLTVPTEVDAEPEPLTLAQSTDALLTAGLQIGSTNVETAADELLGTSEQSKKVDSSIDDVLSDWGGVIDTLDET